VQHRQLPSLNTAPFRVSSSTRLVRILTLLVVLVGLAIVQPTSVAASSTSKLPPPGQSAAVSLRSTAAQLSEVVTTTASKPSREVFGFALASSLSDSTFGYPSWKFSLLSTVAFFGLHINWDGTVVADSGWNVWNSAALTNLVGTAHAAGTKVVLTIILQDFQPGTPNMCAGLINRAVTVGQAAAQALAKGVDGLNVDYEGLNGTCQNGQTSQSMLTDFARQLRAALPAGSYLSIDTYAGAAADTLGFFDVPGLNSYVDSFFVMAYDLEYSNYARSPLNCVKFCLGPTAPLTGYYYNDTSTAEQYVAAVPASKVILGVPYYGRKSCVSAAAPNQPANSSVSADSYLDASGESGAAGVGAGTYAMHRDANDPTGQERWDTWFNTSLNCTRELYWDDTVSLGKKYDLVNSDHLRGVGIWNLNYGGGAPELWSALESHFVGCSIASVGASPIPPRPAGTIVQITASSRSCPNPLYEFWVLAPGASLYTLGQAYSASPTFNWNTTSKATGTYRFSVWVRDASSAGTYGNSSGTYDSYDANLYYTLTVSCSAVGVSTAPLSPVAVGAQVAVTASASGCPNPLYEFWVLAPGASLYTIGQGYSISPTFNWNTTGKAAGSYRFSVWVRDAGSGGAYGNSSGTYDAYYANLYYSLTGGCQAVNVSASPASPGAVGTPITMTVSASGCSNPLYEFWVLAPGASLYTLGQAYSTGPAFTWNTTGKATGSYRFSVWVRDAGSAGTYGNSSGTYDAYNANLYYTLTASCPAVYVSASPASPAAVGTPITVSAGASGCPNPLYEFWVLAPGASLYTLGQAYSSNGVFNWNMSGKAAGTYRLSVWVRDAGSAGIYGNSSGTYDAYNASLYYTLTASCSAVNVSASPASPGAVGSQVTVTASASGCPNPLYEFWVLAPGASLYTLGQAYSSNGVFNWNTSGKAAGTYRFSVWVRDASSAGTYGNSSGRYDAYNANLYYTLN